MSVRYRTGDWHAAITPQGFAVLPADVSLVLVEGIWGRVSAGAGLGGVLEALTGAFGTSLSTIPSFAVVAVTGSQARLAVRGPLAVSVQTQDAATVVVTGLGVTTWSERVISDVVSIDVTVDDALDTGSWYPIADGIVPASAVRLTLAAAPSGPVPVAAPASAAAPAVTKSADAAAAIVRTPSIPPAVAPPAAAIPSVAPATSPPPAAVPTPEVSADTLLPADTSLEAIPAGGGLVDAIPATLKPSDDEFDHLWGATVVKPLSEAAVRPDAPTDDEESAPAAPAPAAPAPSASAAPAPSASALLPTEPLPLVGDHDGETITFEDLLALRGDSAPAAATPAAPGPTGASGRGWIEVSTGERVALDRPIVIGRRPRAVRVTGGVLPHLIAVPSPQQDISRSHIEIRREGDSTLVVDLDTTNGTVLIRAGASPVRLHPGDATMLIDEDVIDLGDGVTVTVRDIR